MGNADGLRLVIDSMRIFTFWFVIVTVIVLTIKSKDEKLNFKSIDFQSKEKYLIVKFLFGNCGLKTNNAVLSRRGDEFLLETETKEGVIDTFRFNVNQILDINVQDQLGRKTGHLIYSDHSSPNTFGRHSTYTVVQDTKYSKEYIIRISLQGDIRLCMVSKKNPDFMFVQE